MPYLGWKFAGFGNVLNLSSKALSNAGVVIVILLGRFPFLFAVDRCPRCRIPVFQIPYIFDEGNGCRAHISRRFIASGLGGDGGGYLKNDLRFAVIICMQIGSLGFVEHRRARGNSHKK